MDPILMLLLAGGGLFAAKTYLSSSTSPAAASSAKVPRGQVSNHPVAPGIRGHALPTPPEHSRSEINAFAQTLSSTPIYGTSVVDPIARTNGAAIIAQMKAIPWPDAAGIWRDDNGSGGDGAPHVFRGCDGHFGHPGYMPLSYLAQYQTGVGCDGQPHPVILPGDDPETAYQNAMAAAGADASSTSSGGGPSAGAVIGQVAQAAGSAVSLATTAAGIAGAAAGASSGAGAAAGAAAAIGGALACLGPVPSLLC